MSSLVADDQSVRWFLSLTATMQTAVEHVIGDPRESGSVAFPLVTTAGNSQSGTFRLPPRSRSKAGPHLLHRSFISYNLLLHHFCRDQHIH